MSKPPATPARFTASAFAANGAPAYVYRFSYIPASMREQWRNGVPHGAEVPYAFDTLGAGRGAAPTPQDQAVRPDGQHLLGQLRQDGPSRTVLACRNGRVTIPARTRSSSSGPTVRRSPSPIPGKRGWT